MKRLGWMFVAIAGSASSLRNWISTMEVSAALVCGAARGGRGQKIIEPVRGQAIVRLLLSSGGAIIAPSQLPRAFGHPCPDRI